MLELTKLYSLLCLFKKERYLEFVIYIIIIIIITLNTFYAHESVDPNNTNIKLNSNNETKYLSTFFNKFNNCCITGSNYGKNLEIETSNNSCLSVLQTNSSFVDKVSF